MGYQTPAVFWCEECKTIVSIILQGDGGPKCSKCGGKRIYPLSHKDRDLPFNPSRR